MNEYEAKLPDEMLYLLRLKAMAEEVVMKDFSCTFHEELYSYLMDPDHKKQYINNQENGGPYFENLRKAIGKKEDSKPADEDYKVSVTTLKRLYGKAKSKKPVSMNTLNYIAGFISDSQYKWDQLPERVDILTRELEIQCLWQGSMRMRVRRPRRNGKVRDIYSAKLIKGDKVRVTFNSGRELGLYYEGDYWYKVTATRSSILRTGYTMVIGEMHKGGRVTSADMRDETGKPIEEGGYESDLILSIEFEGGQEAEWQRVCTALNSSALNSRKNTRTFAEKSEKGMNMKEMKKKSLCVMGAGALNFDVIMKREYPEGFVPGKRNKFEDRVMIQELGSNTGNVMCILGYFGWDSYPIALLGDDAEGLQMKKDFERYHCNTRFVTNTKEGGSNIFTIIHKLDENGNPVKSHGKRHAPGSGFPCDKALSVMGKYATLPKFIEALDFLPDVYFFSNGGAGWRDLGKHMRSQGVLVYYEVQSMGSKELNAVLKCMKEADIVKFSDETVQDVSFVDELKDKLVIQTLGEKGARFNLCGRGWVTLPPVLNENVVDTEGCGDWTTASFINALGQRGVLKLEDMTEAVVKECLEEAQQYASRNVSYLGTKGVIATDKEFGLEPSTFVAPEDEK